MCFRRTDRWTKDRTEDRRDDDLVYLFQEEPPEPERPTPVVEHEPERKPAEERERVPAGVDG
jgi:hypothetical protein